MGKKSSESRFKQREEEKKKNLRQGKSGGAPGKNVIELDKDQYKVE